MSIDIRQGECREVLATLPAASVHCVITSPSYYGLRDYGCAGQIGLEAFGRKDVGLYDHGQAGAAYQAVTSAVTRGWQAGCTCDAGPPLPCTTLDPFLGSGTVALVSKRLGRSCVGIELNPSYCELAQRRVESTPYTLFSGASTSTGAAR